MVCASAQSPVCVGRFGVTGSFGRDSVAVNGSASSALNAQAEVAFLPSLNPAPEPARGIH